MKIFPFAVAFAFAASVPAVVIAQGHNQPTHRAKGSSLREHAFSIVPFMHAPRTAIEGVLGKPYDTSPDNVDHQGVFCDYLYRGDHYKLEYEKGKAVYVFAMLSKDYKSPEAAMAAVGVNVSRRKPTESFSIERLWTGNLGLGAVHRVFVNCREAKAGRWYGVELSDTEDGQ